MIQEVLDKILDAEKEADKLVNNALEEAKMLNIKAETKCEEIINEAKQKAKDNIKNVTESANAEAEQRYNEIIQIGKNKIEASFSDLDITNTSKFIKETFIRKYSN